MSDLVGQVTQVGSLIPGPVGTGFTVVGTAWDIGKTIGNWLFGGGKKVSQPAPLPAWAQQGTPAYGEWSYQNVPAKRLVYIDRITGGHRVFGPSQAAALIVADLPPLPVGSIVTLDPATTKTGVLNKAAVDRALKGCPSAPQQPNVSPVAPAPAVVPPPVSAAPPSPRLEQFFTDLALAAVPRAAQQLAPYFGDLTRPAGTFRPQWPREQWGPNNWPDLNREAPLPPPPDTEGNWTDDSLAPDEPTQPNANPTPPAPVGCCMPCCAGSVGGSVAPRRPARQRRLRPNVTIICGGRKRKL